MPLDHTRTARGAIAGAAAAAAWAAQQPIDKRLFRSRYDDTELLGKAIRRGRGARTLGTALHLANGAAFGAVYSHVAPLVPIPAWVRGPAAGLAEHLALWPLVRVTDRYHPARDELPALAGNRRAFAQAAWRHVLFGAVLGELERRMNVPPPDAPPGPFDGYVSRNGHGKLEHAAPAAPAA